MGCFCSRVENGRIYDTFDQNPITADDLLKSDNLEKQIEDQVVFYKMRNRKSKKDYDRKIQEFRDQQAEKDKKPKKRKNSYQLNEYYLNNTNNTNSTAMATPSCSTTTDSNDSNNIILSYNSQQLPRSSSFNFEEICVHCEHKHLFNCCRYYFDTTQDAIDYAIFKINLEKPREIQIKQIPEIPEALCGQFFPSNFPKYSYKLRKPSCPSVMTNWSRWQHYGVLDDNFEHRATNNNHHQFFRIFSKSKDLELTERYWKDKRIALKGLAQKLFEVVMVIA